MLLCLYLPWLAKTRLFYGHGSTSDYLAMAALLLCAFAATTYARSHRLLAGLLVAIPASVLAVIVNAVRQFLGYSCDLCGASGALAAFILSLLLSFAYAAIGAGLACLVACVHAWPKSIVGPRGQTRPATRFRFAPLLIFGTAGAAVGLGGQFLTTSRMGYVAVPIFVALGWCLAHDTSFWSRPRSKS
jgi:hypothetical protein